METGPHTTVMGQVRERLASTGWIKPPIDPLQECEISLKENRFMEHHLLSSLNGA